jgi:hypothetical protein
MKKINNMKKFLSLALAIVITASISIIYAMPVKTAYAAGISQNSITLSTNSITVTEGGVETFTAALPIGFDASRLACVSSDETVATVTPVAVLSNVASYAVSYVNTGSAVVAVYNIDNPAMVAYITVTASRLVMDIPAKLGTNKDNYCSLVSYEFVPYGYTYENFNDYKYTLNIKYKCSSYKDTGFNKWGCYGYFYDANGNVIKKVHLYASSLSKDRVYSSEFDVPVNAVKFRVEGFN